MNLFAKNFIFINIEVLFKNYKIHTRENWDQNKNKTDIFKDNKNANAKKNNRNIVNFDYNSNNNI